MKNFTISQVERLCGVRPHTIRIWEKRYGFLKPERNPGNIRIYTLDEVELLMYVCLINRNGVKIGRLRGSDISQLKNFVENRNNTEYVPQSLVIRMVVAFYDSRNETFESILDDAEKILGYNNLVHQVILPFLVATNLTFYTENTADIHFAVTAIRKKLLVAIDQTVPISDNNTKAVLFLPEGEHFDLILLYVYFVLKSQGCFVYYLGTNVSEQTLRSVILSKLPHYLYVYSVPNKRYKYENYAWLADPGFPKTILTVIGSVELKKTSDRVKFSHFSSFSLPKNQIV